MRPADVEGRLRSFFEADPRGAIAVYLFGSVARAEARADSDVDIGILFAADPPATLAAPQFNRASSDLVHRVLRDGRLILDLDRSTRIRFEVRSRNEYFDMAAIRALYRGYPEPARSGPDRVAERRG